MSVFNWVSRNSGLTRFQQLRQTCDISLTGSVLSHPYLSYNLSKFRHASQLFEGFLVIIKQTLLTKKTNMKKGGKTAVCWIMKMTHIVQEVSSNSIWGLSSLSISAAGKCFTSFKCLCSVLGSGEGYSGKGLLKVSEHEALRALPARQLLSGEIRAKRSLKISC